MPADMKITPFIKTEEVGMSLKGHFSARQWSMRDLSLFQHDVVPVNITTDEWL